MSIDASFEDFLTALSKQPDISEFSPVENRVRMKEMYQTPNYDEKLAAIVAIDKNIIINNEQLTVRIYQSSHKNSACLVWIHGGGFVFGSLDSSDLLCRKIAAEANLTIFSVDYRLAPENKFPAALDDCYETTQWVIKHAVELGINVDKILIAGVSAGATLAAATCLMMRDKGYAGIIKHQFLMMPVVDNNFKTKSYERYGENYLLTTQSMKYFINHYIKDEADLLSPYCLPGKAQNLKDLPPAMIITLECDPLHDEGESFAKRLTEAGNQVEYYSYPGLFHGFIGQVQSNDFAKQAVDKMVVSYVSTIKEKVGSGV